MTTSIIDDKMDEKGKEIDTNEFGEKVCYFLFFTNKCFH
jgi:hypothetical protein